MVIALVLLKELKKQMKENNEITTKTVGKGKEREMMINLNK